MLKFKKYAKLLPLEATIKLFELIDFINKLELGFNIVKIMSKGNATLVLKNAKDGNQIVVKLELLTETLETLTQLYHKRSGTTADSSLEEIEEIDKEKKWNVKCDATETN